MSTKREQILRMLADGKISVEEADQLLGALAPSGAKPAESGEKKSDDDPRYLRIEVTPKRGDKHVNLRVPLALVRAGAKLGGLLPEEAKGRINEALHAKGIDLDINDAKGDKLTGILQSLQEFSIDVDDEDEHVRIFTE
ncbi:MAG: hypothetical protein ABIJ61_07040 [bacterium]